MYIGRQSAQASLNLTDSVSQRLVLQLKASLDAAFPWCSHVGQCPQSKVPLDGILQRTLRHPSSGGNRTNGLSLITMSIAQTICSISTSSAITRIPIKGCLLY